MASEIISEPTSDGSIGSSPTPKESRLGSDMPESSMQRHPVMIICDLSEGAMEQLQQIFMAQKNPQFIQEDGDVGGTSQGVRGMDMLPQEVVEEFQECLQHHEINRLLERVDQFPAELFLHTVNTNNSRSALHVAILESSQTLVRTLLEKLEEGGQSTVKDLEMDVQDFMLKVDDFGLSAVHMAALIGNKGILSHFGKIFECEITIFDPLFNDTNLFQDSEDEKMNLIENEIEKARPLLDKQAPHSIHQGIGQLSIRQWLLDENIDFVYCLHEALRERNYSQKKAQGFVKHVLDRGDSCFLVPLLNIQDKLGRFPLHGYSYEWKENMIPLLKRLVAHFPNLDLNMPDFSGRTPLHWAAAQGFVEIVIFLISQNKTNLNAMYGNSYKWKIKKNTNFNVDDVSDVTPLHLAIIHNHVEVVEVLLKVPKGKGLDVNAICRRDIKFFDGIPKDKYICSWTPFQLAAYMGHERILQMLLKDPRLYDPGLKKWKKSAPRKHNGIPALHLATSQFHPLAVKALVDYKGMDILVKDKEENTALHYATMHAHGQLQVHANLHDYVTVSHFTSKTPKTRKPSDDDIMTCMDILVQPIFDVEQKNKIGIVPTLQSSCSKNVKKWWLNILKKTEDNKNDLITAANSVSITAALVAAISFAGPLQPPLGLLDDENPTWLDGYSHVKHTSVEIFLFCNSLSFYFAIAAIIIAILVSWPISREWRFKDGRIARRCVQVAMLFLFASIIFIICAFSAANIAIVPNKRW